MKGISAAIILGLIGLLLVGIQQHRIVALMTVQQTLLINTLSEEDQAYPDAEPTTYRCGAPILGSR